MSCPIMSSLRPKKMCFLVDIGFRYGLWVLSFPKGNCSCSSTQKELHGAKQNWQSWILYCWLKKSCTSWGWSFIPGITRFHTSQVVQAFFHQKFSKRVDCRGLRFWDSYFTLLGPKLIEGISSCLQHRGSLCSCNPSLCLKTKRTCCRMLMVSKRVWIQLFFDWRITRLKDRNWD